MNNPRGNGGGRERLEGPFSTDDRRNLKEIGEMKTD